MTKAASSEKELKELLNSLEDEIVVSILRRRIKKRIEKFIAKTGITIGTIRYIIDDFDLDSLDLNNVNDFLRKLSTCLPAFAKLLNQELEEVKKIKKWLEQ